MFHHVILVSHGIFLTFSFQNLAFLILDEFSFLSLNLGDLRLNPFQFFLSVPVIIYDLLSYDPFSVFLRIYRCLKLPDFALQLAYHLSL